MFKKKNSNNLFYLLFIILDFIFTYVIILRFRFVSTLIFILKNTFAYSSAVVRWNKNKV